MKTKKREAGFTLISVMIAMILLVVGISALSRTGFETLRAQTAAATRTTALDIARTYLEDLRTRDPASLASETAVVVDETGRVSSTGYYQRSVDVQVLAKNLKQVTVRVRTSNLKTAVELVTMTFVPQI